MSSSAVDNIARVLGGEREERLLSAFFVLYKTARIMDENNATFKNQSSNFFELLRRYGREFGEVELKVVGGRYLVGDLLVRFNESGLSGAAAIAAEWKQLGVGGVGFARDISLSAVERFFQFVSTIRPQNSDLESLSLSLKSHQLVGIEFLSAKDLNAFASAIPEEIRRQFRAAARSTFFKAMKTVEEVIVNTAQDNDINISKTKRVVQSLIDQITRDESSMIELAAIKSFDDYTYAHSTNVCVYALTLGVRLGLDRARLSQLGFAALFHDIGKVKLPTDLIRKPDAFDENDWVQMQRHPQLGAKTILRSLSFDIHTARAARGAIEHHINNDFTGYPMLRHKKRPTNLFSRVIAIVDTFDAMTSGRVYIKKAVPPDRVLKKMHYQMKTKFDHFLLKIFNNIIGIFPAGTLVLLTTDEIALVITNQDSEMSRPFVKIVGNRDGLCESPLWVDLSQEDQADRQIVRMIDPARYNLDTKQFILQD